jgi:hypothetical protein
MLKFPINIDGWSKITLKLQSELLSPCDTSKPQLKLPVKLFHVKISRNKTYWRSRERIRLQHSYSHTPKSNQNWTPSLRRETGLDKKGRKRRLEPRDHLYVYRNDPGGLSSGYSPATFVSKKPNDGPRWGPSWLPGTEDPRTTRLLLSRTAYGPSFCGTSSGKIWRGEDARTTKQKHFIERLLYIQMKYRNSEEKIKYRIHRKWNINTCETKIGIWLIT